MWAGQRCILGHCCTIQALFECTGCFFYWSALKMTSAILHNKSHKKVSEFPKGVALLGRTSKRTLYEIEKPRVPDKSFQII